MISFTKRFLWLWIVIGVETAQAAVPLPEVTEDLRQRLQVIDNDQKFVAGGVELRRPLVIIQFYTQREYRPAWLNADGPLASTDAFLRAVENAEREGLRPGDYHDQKLSNLLATVRTEPAVAVQRWAELDLLFTNSWLTYASHLLAGRLNPPWAAKSRSKDLLPILQQALEQGNPAEALAALSPAQPDYVRLRTALADYREIARKGGWGIVSSGPKLTKGVRNERVKELRARLRVTGELVKDTATGLKGGEDLFDENLRQAVSRFQRRHGLPDDGVVGADTLAALNVPIAQRIRQIEANLERWRWLPDDLGQRYVLVNVPDFSMVVIEHGQRVLEAKVIVGKSVLQTPVFTAKMSYLVLNPRWHVPASIAIKDKLPQLRRDPYALARQNIRIYSHSGQEIDPGSVDWNTVGRGNFPYRLRQDPGPRNALGRVKFMFPNPFNVYLHDTPSQGLFSRSQRTFSHGCIRISKPIELAEYVLRDDPRWTRDTILSASTGRRERIVKLPEEIPVHIIYRTAWVAEDGTVNFRDDIYQRDNLSVKGHRSI
jgi:murein L,D-transpeptidase YcbB/YkuD